MYCTLQNGGVLQSISGKTLSLSAGVNLEGFMAYMERQQSVSTCKRLWYTVSCIMCKYHTHVNRSAYITYQTNAILKRLPNHNFKFSIHKSVYRYYILRAQPTKCDVSQFIFYFCKTLYMFQTGFPSIIRSSKLHIHRQAFVILLLLPDAVCAVLSSWRWTEKTVWNM